MAKSPGVTKPNIPRPREAQNLPTLEQIDPFATEHPAWVREKHPDYAVQSHAAGADSSVRVLHSQGRVIEITTTYSVTIDGHPAQIHMMVDTDGQLWSHLCPYRTFPNAIDLVRYLLEHAPEALAGVTADGSGGHSGHAGPGASGGEGGASAGGIRHEHEPSASDDCADTYEGPQS